LAIGRVSAEDVMSMVAIPSETTAAMDGYAVRWSDLKSASPERPCSLRVKGSIYPGTPPGAHPLRSGVTYYIATGAPLPKGADSVIRVEEAVRSERNMIIVRRAIQKGKNVAIRGEDIHGGQRVVRRGQVLDPTDVSLLIGVGRQRIRAYKFPTVGLLSVGNELREFVPAQVNVDHKHRDGRITNNYLNLVSGFVTQFGSEAISLGTCQDDVASVQRAVLSGFEKECDVVFTIGGSSVGRRDNVLNALETVPGARALYHGARLVPIRPSGVVMVRKRPVVIIPGHAVSALLTFFVIALPILNLMSGLSTLSRRVLLTAEAKRDIVNDRAIDALFLVKLEIDEKSGGTGSYYFAEPLRWGSNLLFNLSQADGFVRLLPRQTIARKQMILVQLFAATPIAKSTWSFPRG